MSIDSNLIANIHNYLACDVANMNQLILQHLSNKEDLIENICKYLINAGGKRIRPILTILTCKMFSYKGEHHIKLATAVELIHAATLLHDDVIDESKVRRFKPTANIIWGNKATILVGDFLFSQAFKLMVAAESLSCLSVLSQAASIIAEGEVCQLARLGERRILNEEEYKKIIYAKTAELFGAACEVGAIISNQTSELCDVMRQFGINLGYIFQVSDDLLDYVGNESKMGKNIGDDFMEGKVTLPLIMLYSKLELKQQDWLKQLIASKIRTIDNLIEIQKLFIFHQIKQEVIRAVDIIGNETKLLLQKITDQVATQNHNKNYLEQLLDFAIKRVH